MKILKYINHCFFWSFVISLFMMIWSDEPAIGKTCITSVLGVIIMSCVIGKRNLIQKNKEFEEIQQDEKTAGCTEPTIKSGFRERLEEAQKAQAQAKRNKRDY